MSQHRTTPRRRPRALIPLAALSAVATGLAACAASPAPEPSASETSAGVTRSAAPEGDLPDDLQTELQATLDATMAEYGVPGAAVGVWVPGEGSWTTTVGLADVDSETPATTDMQWPMRSITKSYTVTLILQLADEGLIGLDDTIDQYVDGITDGDTITLRELADMSSGNADYTPGLFPVFLEDTSRIFTLDELNSYVVDQPAQFEPGARKVYTNANTNLLGAVVEEATGQEFADVLSERILEPLGQEGTRYIVDASTWTDAHALGYMPGDAGALETPPDNLSIFGPAGSMISTLDDARVWGEVLATGGLLTPETQAEREVGAPLEKGPPYDIYALGMGETDGWWGHNGEGLGFTAANFHNPETGATIAVFMNLSDTESGDHPADQLFRRFAAVLENGAG